MSAFLVPSPVEFSRSLAVLALLALGAGLSGCASVGDNMSSAFADPAKYDLYECKQLETERARLAARAAELQGLMAKAETGVGGSVVAELAYRNELYCDPRTIETGRRGLAAQQMPGIASRSRRLPRARPAAPPAPAAGVRGSPSHRRDAGTCGIVRRRAVRIACAMFTPASRRSSPAAPASALGPSALMVRSRASASGPVR